ncbi:MAG: metallophosphoesterase [Lachnospiraceae bacterium]|nr:metallophosphoesterase [Lachnospiraceae bacterium]
MKKFLKILGIILGSFAAIYLIIFVINVCCNMSLRKYIKSFDKVDYTGVNRVVPVKEDGFYTFKTDGELKIMTITDIHIGGGFWTFKKDKKAIYEIMLMLQAEKPDLVILGGDNVYAVPGPGYGGGFTFNNKMVAKTVATLFNYAGVYFSTVLGNHDTEAFDYARRAEIGKLYASDKFEYSIFESMYTDKDAKTIPSVSNQFILVKNTAGKITKILLLIDSNDYVDTSIMSSVKQRYDVIHDAQVDWAAGVIKDLSKKEGLPDGEYLKTLLFLHIPVGEYRVALDELIEEVKDEKGNVTAYVQRENPGPDTEYVSGVWADDKVYYGGLNNGIEPAKEDKLFEVLCDEMHSVEAMFCGHDHLNNAVVRYKGVLLSYNYSVDNIAYKGIHEAGLQRGATLISLSSDGSYTIEHKNAYLDYGVPTDTFFNVYTDHELHPEWLRTVE